VWFVLWFSQCQGTFIHTCDESGDGGDWIRKRCGNEYTTKLRVREKVDAGGRNVKKNTGK